MDKVARNIVLDPTRLNMGEGMKSALSPAMLPGERHEYVLRRVHWENKYSPNRPLRLLPYLYYAIAALQWVRRSNKRRFEEWRLVLDNAADDLYYCSGPGYNGLRCCRGHGERFP
jgi:hypothetical protein